MTEGYYASRNSAIEYWVHNHLSHSQVMALRYLPDLLKSLHVNAAFNNSDLLDYEDRKHFFNVAYRGDFEHQPGYCSCYDAKKHIWQCTTDNNHKPIILKPTLVEPKPIDGCELVLPLTVANQHISGIWPPEHKLTLGISPFLAYDDANQFNLEHNWHNEAMTGKNMNHSAILKCQSPWRFSDKLFTGLLHGIDGRTLSKSALDDWLSAMLEVHNAPTKTFVLFAPVMSIGNAGTPVYQWFGIYHYQTPTCTCNHNQKWTAVNDLIDDKCFWQALLQTGSVHDSNRPPQQINEVTGDNSMHTMQSRAAI